MIGPVKRASNWVFNSSGGQIDSTGLSYEDNIYLMKANQRSRQQQLRGLSQTPAEELKDGYDMREDGSP